MVCGVICITRKARMVSMAAATSGLYKPRSFVRYTMWRDDLVTSFNRYVEQSESVVAYSSSLSPRFRPPMTRDYWIEQMWLTKSWQSMLSTTHAVVSVVEEMLFIGIQMEDQV